MHQEILPDALVRHPPREDRGLDQVQPVIGGRITVNSERAGKHLINGDAVSFVPVGTPERLS